MASRAVHSAGTRREDETRRRREGLRSELWPGHHAVEVAQCSSAHDERCTGCVRGPCGRAYTGDTGAAAKICLRFAFMALTAVSAVSGVTQHTHGHRERR